MTKRMIHLAIAMLALPILFASAARSQNGQTDWARIEEETMRHFQAILRMDTSNPPGNEKIVVDYMKSVLDREGIETKLFALDPQRPNLVARLRGSGKKRPVLIMGHTDVVKVDPAKWTHPPFSATREGGYVYGRGTVDDKDNAVAGLMVMLMLKRMNVPLDRDVIFLAEAGEEASTKWGIQFMVDNHWAEIDAEFCFAEGGGVVRTGGKIRFATVQASEKIPYSVILTARGPAGHGSVPLRTNAVVHLSQAIARIAAWQTPMRLNETTKAYFERLATISAPDEAHRYQNVANPELSAAIQEYFAVNEPRYHSMLRTSISPNIVKGGYQVNVIPSEAVATLDVRALPDENIDRLLDEIRRVINDPAIQVTREGPNTRPLARPSRIDSEAFKVIEGAVRQHYNAVTLPTMSTGATDMAYLRAKGVECYGVGPMTDSEDGPKGFGAHSDQERILEEALHKFVRFHWDIVVHLAKAR
ncbi:MAG: M20/M25/M40 family metallo-hydrolase [Blastocatellia bacterium]|nr:M20/M25/M40 family metallo-hydrolase [Blastocatellia bacterium]